MVADLRDKEWQHEWTHSGSYHSTTGEFLPYAAQTKQWFPEAGIRMNLMKFGRPTVGFLIQFITGHGWFGRHRSKFDEDFPYLCRFCNTAREDPEHLWSSCRNFNGVRHAIRQLRAAFYLLNNPTCGQSHNWSGSFGAIKWTRC